MKVDPLDISASGLRAQRIRMETIANNLANSETTSGSTVEEGGFIKHIPYRRRNVVFSSKGKDLGVHVPRVVDDITDFRREFSPEHPHAVKNPNASDFGHVYFPNVNPIVEMVDMLAASRAYEANITAIETLKVMSSSTLRILA